MIHIIKHTKQVLNMMTNGCTEPVRAYLDDNTYVIAKLYNNCEGNLILFNEYLSYSLAVQIELPIPVSGICLIDEQTIDENHTLSPQNFGYAFYSTYLQSTILKPGIIKHLQNLNYFYRLLLFDHLIYNKDRNVYNLLTTFTKKDTSFSLIDHSHVFKNETIWDANCFRLGIAENDYMDTYILETNAPMYDMFLQTFQFDAAKLNDEVSYIQNRITIDVIDKAIAEIPSEWKPSQNNIDALREYLLYRNSHLQDICDMIVEQLR